MLKQAREVEHKIGEALNALVFGFGAEIVSNKKIVQRLFLDKRDGLKNMTLILADQTPKLGAYKQRDLFMGVDVPV